MITTTSEQILTPLAETVSQLILFVEEAEANRLPMPDLTGVAQNVSQNVLNLANVGISIQSSLDPKDNFYKRLGDACSLLADASAGLQQSTMKLKEDGFHKESRKLLLTSIKSMLNGTRDVLDTNDDIEIAKIAKSLNASIQYLDQFQHLVTVKEMASVVQAACKSFVQSVSLTRPRIPELMDPSHRQGLEENILTITQGTPLLVSSMKCYVIDTSNEESNKVKTSWIETIKKAFEEIKRMIEMKKIGDSQDQTIKLKESFNFVSLAEKAWAVFDTVEKEKDYGKASQILDSIKVSLEGLRKDFPQIETEWPYLESRLTEMDMILKGGNLNPQQREKLYNFSLDLHQKLNGMEKSVYESIAGPVPILIASISHNPAPGYVDFLQPNLVTIKTIQESIKNNELSNVTQHLETVDDNAEVLFKIAYEIACKNPSQANLIATSLKKTRDSYRHVTAALKLAKAECESGKYPAGASSPAREYVGQVMAGWETDITSFMNIINDSIPSECVLSTTKKTIEAISENPKTERKIESIKDVVNIAKQHVEKHAINNTNDESLKKEAETCLLKIDEAVESVTHNDVKPLLNAIEVLENALYKSKGLDKQLPVIDFKEVAVPVAVSETNASAGVVVVDEEEPQLLSVEEAEANPIKAAAQELFVEAAKWAPENNVLIANVSELSQLLAKLSECYNCSTAKKELIDTTTNIISVTQQIIDDSLIIAEHCSEKRLLKHLVDCLERLPTIGQQLKVLSAVKASNPRDSDAEKQLITCARNIMSSVKIVLNCCESASLRWVDAPPATSYEKIKLLKSKKLAKSAQASTAAQVRFVRKVYKRKAFGN